MNHELFEHQADVGVRGRGATREAAFEQAALALTSAVTDLSSVEPRDEMTVLCDAPDDELLFADWLNALIGLMSSRRVLFSRFEVRLADGRLIGRAWGEPVDPARHQPAVEVKGATYTALSVRQEQDGTWLAQCVVDV